jgi:hypothetical protein
VVLALLLVLTTTRPRGGGLFDDPVGTATPTLEKQNCQNDEPNKQRHSGRRYSRAGYACASPSICGSPPEILEPVRR